MKMREFTKNDWRTYAGAAMFSDGESPWVGEYNENLSGDFVVTVDAWGLQAFYYNVDCYVVTGIEIQGIHRDFGVMIGNQILSDVEGMDEDEIVTYLESHKQP